MYVPYILATGTTCSPPSPAVDSPTVHPLELANALSTCVLSARLRGEHRQWAVQQLVHTLGALAARCNRGNSGGENLADLAGDLPSCPSSKLEGHQNRVTGMSFSGKKNLLASR